MSLRYQLVAYSGELGSAIEFESMSFKISSGSKVHFDQFQIYVGHTNLTELGEEYEANYNEGSKTLVYDRSDLWLNCGAPGEWFTIELDESFWYNGQDNLIIDFIWPAGEEAFYVWGWYDTVNRSVSGAYDAPTGSVSGESLLMNLNGELSLQPNSFGSIKATLGN